MEVLLKEQRVVMKADFKSIAYHLFSVCFLYNFSVGSLIIEHDVVTKNDVVTSQELAETIYRTIDGSETVRLEFGGIKVTVKEVLVEQRKGIGTSFYRTNNSFTKLAINTKMFSLLSNTKLKKVGYIFVYTHSW